MEMEGLTPPLLRSKKNNALSPALLRKFQTCAHGAHTLIFIYYLLSKKAALRVLRRAAFSKGLAIFRTSDIIKV